jgi:hypothetical protein
VAVVITVMHDYQCDPLWVSRDGSLREPETPEHHGLSASLAGRFEAWRQWGESRLNLADPHDSRPVSDEEDAAFDSEGRLLAIRRECLVTRGVRRRAAFRATAGLWRCRPAIIGRSVRARPPDYDDSSPRRDHQASAAVIALSASRMPSPTSPAVAAQCKGTRARAPGSHRCSSRVSGSGAVLS